MTSWSDWFASLLSSSPRSSGSRRPPHCRECRKRGEEILLKNHICPHKLDSDGNALKSDTAIHPDSGDPFLPYKRRKEPEFTGDEETSLYEDSGSPSDNSPPHKIMKTSNKAKGRIIATPNRHKRSKPTTQITDLPESIISLRADRIIVGDEVLGTGGFGAVLIGQFDGASVAIKNLYNPDLLRKEAEFMQSLRHPNIVQYFGFCVEKKCLVLELCDVDLSDVIKEGTLSEIDIREYAIGITRGVRYLHNEGVSHRDLKPGNILFKGGIPKLADFGISKMMMTQNNNTKIGTPHYMAPETFSGQYGKEIDVYALALIFFEMITRTRLEETIFKDMDAFHIAEKIKSQKKSKPTIPRRWGVGNLIRSMLAKEAKNRPKIEEVEAKLVALSPDDFKDM